MSDRQAVQYPRPSVLHVGFITWCASEFELESPLGSRDACVNHAFSQGAQSPQPPTPRRTSTRPRPMCEPPSCPVCFPSFLPIAHAGSGPRPPLCDTISVLQAVIARVESHSEKRGGEGREGKGRRVGKGTSVCKAHTQPSSNRKPDTQGHIHESNAALRVLGSGMRIKRPRGEGRGGGEGWWRLEE